MPKPRYAQDVLEATITYHNMRLKPFSADLDLIQILVSASIA